MVKDAGEIILHACALHEWFTEVSHGNIPNVRRIIENLPMRTRKSHYDNGYFSHVSDEEKRIIDDASSRDNQVILAMIRRDSAERTIIYLRERQVKISEKHVTETTNIYKQLEEMVILSNA